MKMKKDNLFGEAIYIDILIALMIIIVAFLSSCTTQRKATKYFDSHGFEAARYCAGAFPVKSDSVFKPGKPIRKTDTTYLPSDSVPCPPGGKDTLFIPCPPSPVIHDSVFVHDTLRITKKDSAELAVLRGIIQRKTQDSIKTSVKVESWKHKARNRGKIIWIAVSIIVLVGAGWIFFKGKMGVIKSIIKKIKS